MAELFQELEASVIQQDAPVEDIKRTGEEVVDSVTKANVELDGAIVNKRKARRRKCWFFGLLRELCGLRQLQFISLLWQFLLSSSLLWSSWSSFWFFEGSFPFCFFPTQHVDSISAAIILLAQHRHLPRPQVAYEGLEQSVTGTWITLDVS